LDAANAVLGGMTCSPFVSRRSGNRPESLPGRWDDLLLELLPLALLADLTLASTSGNPRDDRRVLTPTSTEREEGDGDEREACVCPPGGRAAGRGSAREGRKGQRLVRLGRAGRLACEGRIVRARRR